mgnify:CR=1 FL=1
MITTRFLPIDGTLDLHAFRPADIKFLNRFCWMQKTEVTKEGLKVLLLIMVTACSYLNSLDGAFVFDDSRFYNNPAAQLETFSLPGLVHAVRGMEPATRPVANLTFVLNYLAGGFSVRGYHLVNLGIHVTAGILLYFLLKTLLTLPILQGRRLMPGEIAFASALLWMVHPLQTQAVSYIVQRMTSLAALFFILSFLLYARGRMTGNPDRRFLLMGGSILSWVLAMGSKEIAVTLPLFILLYEWFFLRDLRTDWMGNHKKYLVGVGILLLAVSLLYLGDTPWATFADGYATREFTPGQRVLTECRVIFFYLGLLAFPLPGRLSIEHDFVPSASLLDPMSTLLSIAAILVLLAITIRGAKQYRFEAFCILWFMGNHLVEGTILPLELVFEHRNYLPSMMLIPLGVLGLSHLIANRTVLAVLLCALVALFSFWTYQRNFVWQDELSLWQNSIEKAPGSARAHNNLGVALESVGKLDEAMFHYRETLRLDPGYVAAYYNLGSVLKLRDKISQAIPYYRQAVLLKPDDAVMRMGLADAYLVQGRYEEARTEYLQALRLEPGNREAATKLQGTMWKLNSQQQNQTRK